MNMTINGVLMWLNTQPMLCTSPACSVHCTKWPPELKIKKSCQTFTGQTTGGSSTKLYRSDQNHSLLCTSLACSAYLHKIAARAINRKILSCLHISNYWWDFYQTLQEWSVPSLVVQNTGMFRLSAQNDRQSYK
jgi:hypothetical protein